MTTDTDLNQDISDSGAPADIHDHGDSERRGSVRGALEDAFRNAGVEVPERETREEKDKGRHRRNLRAGAEAEERRIGEPSGPAAREAKAATSAKEQLEASFRSAAEGAADPASGTSQQAGAPAAWTKEAKATWDSLPKVAQQMVLKREQDVAKGIESLKSRYSDLDAVLAPHEAVIRQHGHRPREAVHQLFSWFQHLSRNPRQGLVDLGRAFNVDLGARPPEISPRGD
jgi:hypothetical protein